MKVHWTWVDGEECIHAHNKIWNSILRSSSIAHPLWTRYSSSGRSFVPLVCRPLRSSVAESSNPFPKSLLLCAINSIRSRAVCSTLGRSSLFLSGNITVEGRKEVGIENGSRVVLWCIFKGNGAPFAMELHFIRVVHLCALWATTASAQDVLLWSTSTASSGQLYYKGGRVQMEVCCGRRRRSADNNIMADGMVGGRWLLGSDQKKGLKRRVIFFNVHIGGVARPCAREDIALWVDSECR